MTTIEEWDRDLWTNLEEMANTRPSLPGDRGRFTAGDEGFPTNDAVEHILADGFDLDVDCWATRLA